jgi:hypothetical protein
MLAVAVCHMVLEAPKNFVDAQLGANDLGASSSAFHNAIMYAKRANI